MTGGNKIRIVLHMDVLKLKTFYHVAKLGSLTQSSKQLNYSIANISRQLSSLEKDLGVSLFHRNANKLVLTAHGALLLQKAPHILHEIEATKNILQDDLQHPTGVLRISATNALTSWLTPLIQGFIEQYPSVQLHIYGDDRNTDFTSKACDIYIGPNMAMVTDLTSVHLMSSHIGLYASKQYLEKFGTPTTLEDLDNHALIGRSIYGDLPSHFINWHLVAGRAAGDPRVPFLSHSAYQSIIDISLLGMGIVSLSNTVKNSTQDGLVEILKDFRGPCIDIRIVYPSIMEDSKRITCFKEYLLQNFLTTIGFF